ncbi:UNVERIFIED_CONTAM: flagellar hook-length control protein FliK [Acetivibrio alkalicellulosi]
MKNTCIELFAKPTNSVKEPNNRIRDNLSFQFRDTFNMVVDKKTFSKANDIKISYAKSDKLEYERRSSFQNSQKYNYQNESTKETLKSTNKEMNNGVCEDLTDDIDRRKKAVKESLAQILGIGIEQLTTMLEFLNVDFNEDFIPSELVEELSVFLELDSSEQTTLLSIVDLIEEKIDNVTSEEFQDVEPNQALLEKNNLVISEDLLETVEEVSDSFKEEISLKIKGKLKELAEKETVNLSREITEIFDRVIVSEISSDEIVLPENEEVLSVNLNVNETKLERQASADTESKEGSESEKDNNEYLMEDTFTQKNEATGVIQNETYVEGIGSISNEHSQSQQEIKELVGDQKPENVSKKEIASQIVEKAKVLLDGDKSEMVIDLKPDHLGKMALKVVTERGLVIAKFVTESEQVKAAIEANMDTLKESLEKQGFSIQGFSVSVGQNKNRNFKGNSENQSNFGSKSFREREGVFVSGVDVNTMHNKLNPYNIGGSSINLTA